MTQQEINQKFDQMVLDHNGKYWEVEDSAALDQCFDLAFGYCDYLSIPRETIRHAVASQIWTQIQDSTLEYFWVIPNTPNGVPLKGDIIVFAGATGHVSVANGTGDASGFTSFDQNWPTGSYCHFQTHDYKTVLGWLRPKYAEIAQPIPQADLTSKNPHINDEAYQGVLGLQPTTDENQNRQSQNIPLREEIDDLLQNDERAKAKWLPIWTANQIPSVPINPVDDSLWSSIQRFFGR